MSYPLLPTSPYRRRDVNRQVDRLQNQLRTLRENHSLNPHTWNEQLLEITRKVEQLILEDYGSFIGIDLLRPLHKEFCFASICLQVNIIYGVESSQLVKELIPLISYLGFRISGIKERRKEKHFAP